MSNTMIVSVNDVNDVLPLTLDVLKVAGVRQTAASVANARPTLRYPGLFVTEYTNPTRCVLFDPVRDANPFFHYLESMWILMGRRDVAFLKKLLPRMGDYSDDGTTFHGSYGYRLRSASGTFDQIERAIQLLRDSPASRQVVMTIWDPGLDLGTKTKDMPCNDMIMCDVLDGKLNITVCNRSNDAILGAYGANVVQFSMLLMYMAARIGVGVGVYRQVSNNMHVYEDDPYWNKYLGGYRAVNEGYYPAIENTHGGAERYNPFEVRTEFIDADLARFFGDFDNGWVDQYSRILPNDGVSLTHVGEDTYRIHNALMLHRAGFATLALDEVAQINAPDWRMACQRWLTRRMERKGAMN